MTLYILENNLRERLGHFLNSTQGLKREAEARGVDVQVLVNRRASPEVLALVEGRGVFTYNSWEGDRRRWLWRHGPGQTRESAALRTMEILGRSFAYGCRTIESPSADDIILVPTASQAQVHGLAIYLESLPPDRRPVVAMNFHWSNWEGRPDRAAAYRQAYTRLVRAVGPGRLLLTATTAALASSLSRTVDLPVERFPLPLDYGAVKEPITDPADSRPTVAVVGRSLRRKGSQQLRRIVPRLRRLVPGVRLFVQATFGMPLMAFLYTVPVAFLWVFPHVRVHFGGLSMAGYLDLLRSAHITLLPYDAHEYASRSSGVFAECAALGRVAVVPSGTWMAEQLQEGRAAGVAYDGSDPDSIAGAVALAVRELPALAAVARDRADYWWSCESASAYVDRLLEHFSRSSRA